MSNSRRSWVVGALLSATLAACGSDSKTSTDGELPPAFSGMPSDTVGGSEATTPDPSATAPDPAAPSTPDAPSPEPTTPAETNPDLPIAQPEQPAPGGGGTEPVNEDPSAGETDPGTGETPGTDQPPAPEVPPGVDPNFFIFLTFGQSNMEGVPQPQQQDRVENPRVKVMAYDNCANLGRTYNEWYTASPPLHSCGGGVGPGDYFGKTLAAALPEEITIGIVPNAIAGVDIDYFRKGVRSARRNEFRIPPDNQRDSAYDMIIERGRLAQQVGVIKGIIFHQGESDSGSPNRDQWVGKLQQILSDIRTDLNIGNVPFLVGELLYNASGGCCGNSINPLIANLPNQIPNTFAVSAGGLANIDAFHFDLPGQRTLGARYGEIMLDALGF